MTQDSIPSILGHSEAKYEWDDPVAAEANYINIDSYAQFISPDCTIIAGRIGSGKTSMLYKLKYHIESGKNRDYSHVIMLDTKEYIAKLGIALRMSDATKFNYTEIESLALQEWRKTINILIMKALLDKLSDRYPHETLAINSYLQEQGLVSKKFSLLDVFEILANSLGKVGTPLADGAVSLVGHIEKYMTVSYSEALVEMRELLKTHGNFLILIDSVERYEYNETITLAVLNALVSFCVDCGHNCPNISVKLAAPSELIPQLLSTNPEKIANETVYIRWSHDDLKKFISVRLYRQINNISKDSSIDLQTAVDFFDLYYEEECMTRCGFPFPTFSYCISHTLKEPRHILAIFNAWYYYEKKYAKPRMSLVDKAIDYDAITRVKGALSIYNSVHPKMYELFFRTFANRKYCFKESEFDEWVASCSNLRGGLDAYDLKKFFVSSGLVGTMIELHYLKPGGGRLRVDRPIRIKEAIFEYQIKEQLSFNDNTQFCLHPMVYKALNVQVDRNTLVYPKPIELGMEFIPWD